MVGFSLSAGLTYWVSKRQLDVGQVDILTNFVFPTAPFTGRSFHISSYLALVSYLMELAGLIMMMYYTHFSTIVSCKRYLHFPAQRENGRKYLSLYTRYFRTDFIWILGLTILDFASYFLNRFDYFHLTVWLLKRLFIFQSHENCDRNCIPELPQTQKGMY